MFLVKEDISHGDGCNDADEVGGEAVGGCIADLADIDAAEIDGEDVHGGVGRALDGRCNVADEAIDSVGLEHVEHHGSCACAIEWLEHGSREGSDKVGVHADGVEEPAEAFGDVAQGSTFAEDADAHKHSYLIGDDGDHGLESLLRTIDEGAEQRHALANACDEEEEDGAEEKHVAEHRAIELEVLLIEL